MARPARIPRRAPRGGPPPLVRLEEPAHGIQNRRVQQIRRRDRENPPDRRGEHPQDEEPSGSAHARDGDEAAAERPHPRDVGAASGSAVDEPAGAGGEQADGQRQAAGGADDGGSLDGTPGAGYPPHRQDRQERPLPLRLGKEIQELPRSVGWRPLSLSRVIRFPERAREERSSSPAWVVGLREWDDLKKGFLEARVFCPCFFVTRIIHWLPPGHSGRLS